MTDNKSDVYSFCGNSTVWREDVFSSSAPNFTDCFQITVLALLPVVWLLLTLPYYIYKLIIKPVAFPLPLTTISVFKSIICFLLSCLLSLEAWSANNYGYRCHVDQAPPTAFYLAVSANAFVYLFLAVFIQYLRIRNVVSSTVVFTYWVLSTLCGIIPLQSKISYQSDCTTSIFYYVYYGLVLTQLVLHCFADKNRTGGYQYLGKPHCPDGEASTFSYWIFWWFNPIVLKAYRGTLGIHSLWEQTTSLQFDNVIKDFNLEWKKEITKCIRKRRNLTKILRRKSSQKYYLESTEETPLLSSQESQNAFISDSVTSDKPSLYRTIWRLYAVTWLWGTFLNIIGSLSALLQPYILRLLIDYIENSKSRGDPIWIGYTLAVGLAIAGELMSLFFTHSINVCMTLGLRVKTALTGAIYQKSLTMSNASKAEYTTGEIVNLMSVDCLRIQYAFQFSYEILAFWVFMGVGLYELWDLMGIATLGGVGIIIVIGALNAVFGKLEQKYQQAMLKLKGTRIKVLNEALQGIKVLKMYAWEPWFSEKILSIRGKEMKYLRLIAIVTAFSVVCSVHSPFFMNYFIILVYILMRSSQYFDAQKAFGSLSLVNILRYPLTLVPFVITGCVQGYVSVGRIQAFLWKEDVRKDNVKYLEDADYAVSIENGVFTWNPESPAPTLKGMNLNIMEGKLYAVIGQVGSGKSSVVSAILGEMEKVHGEVKIKGSVAYVPQEAWIQNLTLRDNILFGNRYVERKYQRIIKACALEPDLKMLSGGDMTEIGEKGINISGGQKQRVSLARAVYCNADIYLLDDPLSAVDSHVGKDLFSQVIGPDGILRHKTRILVTHGVHWLPKVDIIVVMDNGVISEIGSYDELLYRGGAFAEFVQNVLIQDELSDEEEDPEIAKIKDAIWEQVETVVSDGTFSSDNVVVEGLSRRQSMRRLSRQRSSEADGTRKMSRKASESQITVKQKDKEPTQGQLITEETSEEGSIKFGVTLSYIRAVGILFSFLIVLFISSYQGCNMFGNFWLTFWTEDDYLKNRSLGNTTEYYDTNINYLLIYTLLGIIQGVCLLLFGLTAFLRIVAAAGEMHSSMLRCVFRSPMAFFDTTPVGRIMNRFSSDIDVLDDRMPRTFRMWSMMFFGLLSIIIVISVNTPLFLVAIVPIGVLYISFLRFYLPTARQLKRIESITRSPVFNHFSETIAGASVIRAYRSSDRFIEECSKRVDKNCAFFYAANSSARWVGLRLEFLGNLLVLAASIFAVVSSTLSGADVGLSLTYSMQIIIVLNYIVQSVSEMEMNIVSVERINEYTHLSPEAEWIISSSHPPQNWPHSGKITFQNYATRYRPGLDLVLKGIHCDIKSGEKVGIVGRTGAGKSSLTLSLFRLIEGAGGTIIIDGVRIADLGLHDLRSRITILPQDPVIFSGSLRNNLDPLDNFSDDQIWKALECAHLKSFVESQQTGLMYECGEGGLNLSVGQRQLVCLGRALLFKTKILVLDEATAAVDMETDELIQNTIRTEFRECTVLSIAHRLNTIMDYDRIMVLDKGKIVEMDSPEVLLQNKQGVFYGMAKDAGLVKEEAVKFEA